MPLEPDRTRTRRRRPTRDGALLAALALLVASPVRAGLPAEGWPQLRGDGRRSGSSGEAAIADPVVRWSATLPGPLTGEPVVVGCRLFVTDATGRVHAFNARDGELLWSAEREWSAPPRNVSSHLALDDAGLLLAGLPSDPLIQHAWDSEAILREAMERHGVDEGGYPAGPDLDADLVPLYLGSLPVNPVTGAAMELAIEPSPGDYLHEDLPAVTDYRLGAWGSGDGLIPTFPCGWLPGAAGGLAASWPRSPETGGTLLTLSAEDGTVLRQAVGLAEPSLTAVPAVTPAGASWTLAGSLPQQEGRLARGRLVRTDAEGALLGNSGAWAAPRGGVARDDDGAATFVGLGTDEHGWLLELEARRVASALEAYAIDENRWPATGELADSLVPTYLSCMPPRFDLGGPSTFAATPSPGDYAYESDAESFELWFWDATGEPVAHRTHEAVRSPGERRPPSVLARDDAGAPLWRAFVGEVGDDVAGVLVAPEGVLVALRSGRVSALDAAGGAELWSTEVGGTLVTPPAVLPTGGVVVVDGDGTVVALDRTDGSELWRHDVGSAVTAAPTTTADGTTHVADASGLLHALGPEGAPRWVADLGGPDRAGLSTPAVLSGGWLYLGRTDGTLLALVPRDGRGRPEAPGGLLLPSGEKGPERAGFEWPEATLDDVPGAHFHLQRWSGRLPGEPELLLAHDHAARSAVDDAAAGPLLFYRLRAADCGENLDVSR